jgi:S-layer homology domain
MKMRRTGITALAAAGIATLLITGVAMANPMGSGMGGTTGTTMMQGGTGTGPGMMQPGTTAGTTTQPGTGVGTAHMFTDVAAGDWFAQYAEHMASAGFMTGFDDGTFGAGLPITRGQFAGILGRMMNLPPLAGTTFADTQGFWAAGMVEALARMGIVAGHDDGTFGPYGSITREQMAAMMDRAWDAMHAGATATDVAPAMVNMMQLVHDASGSWAAPQIARMMQMGVFMGDNGMFHPTDTATRAQAAAVMWRWFVAGQTQQ